MRHFRSIVGGVKRQYYEDYVTVQILMDLTVYEIITPKKTEYLFRLLVHSGKGSEVDESADFPHFF